MKLTLLVVGRLRSGPERELADDYLARLRRLAPSLGLRGVEEVEIADGGGPAREAVRLLARLPAPGAAEATRLDEHGTALSSVGLAETLARWRDSGTPDAVFIIGGADGFAPALARAVPRAIAFGVQTWPHRLVRVMLAEQLYRAATLLAGVPYHKA